MKQAPLGLARKINEKYVQKAHQKLKLISDCEKALQFPRSVSQKKMIAPQLGAGLLSEGNPAARRHAENQKKQKLGGRKAGTD